MMSYYRGIYHSTEYGKLKLDTSDPWKMTYYYMYMLVWIPHGPKRVAIIIATYCGTQD